MPRTNLLVLYALLEFLQEIIEHKDKNKMTEDNLAICFAPNLLKSKNESIEAVIGDAGRCNGVVRSLIFYTDKLLKKIKANQPIHETDVLETDAHQQTIENFGKESQNTATNRLGEHQSIAFSTNVMAGSQEERFVEQMSQQYTLMRKETANQLKKERAKSMTVGKLDEYEAKLIEDYAKFKLGVTDDDIKLDAGHKEEFNKLKTTTLRVEKQKWERLAIELCPERTEFTSSIAQQQEETEKSAKLQKEQERQKELRKFDEEKGKNLQQTDVRHKKLQEKEKKKADTFKRISETSPTDISNIYFGKK